MALVTVQFQIGENTKRKADAICEKLEIDLGTYLCSCILDLIEYEGIPLPAGSPVAELLTATSRAAREGGFADLTMDEINAEIAEVRAELLAERLAEQARLESVETREAVVS